jgi:phosphotransferase system enzyme I (PtsI)
MACDNAHKEGIWCGICGELGADLELTEMFLSIGLDELSVSPRAVLPLRQKVRETQVRVVREKLLAELADSETSF